MPQSAIAEGDGASGRTRMPRRASGRLHIARGLDDKSVRALVAAVGLDSEANLELIFRPGRRERLSRGLSEADLRGLLADSNLVGIELVQSQPVRRRRPPA